MALKHSSFMLKSNACAELTECRLGCGESICWLSRKSVRSAGSDDDDGSMYLVVPGLACSPAAVDMGCKLSNWSGLMVGFSDSRSPRGNKRFCGSGVSADEIVGRMLNKLSWSMGRLRVSDSRWCLGGELNSGVVLAVVLGCNDDDDDISDRSCEYSSAGGPKNTSLCNSSCELRSGTSISGNSGNSWSP